MMQLEWKGEPVDRHKATSYLNWYYHNPDTMSLEETKRHAQRAANRSGCAQSIILIDQDDCVIVYPHARD